MLSASSDTSEAPATKTFSSDLISRCLGVQIHSPGGLPQKIQAATIGLVAIAITFFVGHWSSDIYSFMFPDAAQQRAEALQKVIADKVNSIEQLSRKITDNLSGSENALGLGLKSDTDRLLDAIEELRPELQAAGKIGGDASRLFAEAKQNELNRQRFSVASDFVIPSGQGATVCPDRYIFGIRSSVNTSIEATLSGGGTSTTSALQPGNSLTLKNAEGKVIQVGYQGKFGENENALYGFSVICP